MLKHPLLSQIDEKIRGKVPPQLGKAYEGTINAGLTAMHNQPTHKYMQQALTEGDDIPDNIGAGIAKLVGMLILDAKGRTPMQVLVQAGLALLMEGLQFAEDAGVLQLDEQVVSEATQAYGAYLLQILGVSPEKMEQMLAQAQQQGGLPQGGQPAAPGVVNQAMGA